MAEVGTISWSRYETSWECILPLGPEGVWWPFLFTIIPAFFIHPPENYIPLFRCALKVSCPVSFVISLLSVAVYWRAKDCSSCHIGQLWWIVPRAFRDKVRHKWRMGQKTVRINMARAPDTPPASSVQTAIWHPGPVAKQALSSPTRWQIVRWKHYPADE